MLRKFQFAEGEFYHVYNRGVDKRIIFESVNDFNRFVKLLYIANGTSHFDFKGTDIVDVYSEDRGEQLVDICSYCLMDNHFHLLLKEIKLGGISKFMKKLLTAYSMYFNTKNQRSGALFQGTYRAKHINTDVYLKHISLYIHLNALDKHEVNWKEKGILDRSKAGNFLEEYKYSSFPDYCGVKRKENKILSMDSAPKYYVSVTEMMNDIHDWMEITPELNKLTR